MSIANLRAWQPQQVLPEQEAAAVCQGRRKATCLPSEKQNYQQGWEHWDHFTHFYTDYNVAPCFTMNGNNNDIHKNDNKMVAKQGSGNVECIFSYSLQ